VWADIVRPPVAGTNYAKLNRVLRTQARRRANLIVVDWSGMVRRHPEWLASDGVHVDAAGYRARARAFARAIGRCP
jgi:lysophospholipase L1-like esterase